MAPPATNELVYTGTIGPYPVVLNLQLSDTTDRVTARYYYLSRGSDLALTGQRWADSLDLGETAEPPYNREYFEATAQLRARLSGDSLLTGYWQATGKARRLPVKLRRRPQAYDYAYAARLSPGYWLNGVYMQLVRLTDDSPLIKPDSEAPDPTVELYYDNRYPLVAGLEDKQAEAALNDLLARDADDWVQTRLHPDKSYAWLNACYLNTTTLELLTPELVSIARERRVDGCGSPSMQIQHEYTVLSLPKLLPVPLTEVLHGDYRALFQRYARQKLSSEPVDKAKSDDPNESCTQAYILQSVAQELAAVGTTENMLLTDKGLIIHQFNLYRYCVGPAMTEVEVLIPYAALRPYIRPNSALARAVPAAAPKR
ncbi:DUF3298 domain-containing protein [Hymenobacter busanensis]|uniref:DUF3298 domain-containing protein n=1 Tax=Hymenobacter busanensis TaxID=2607656 RepID=A0A7L5A0Y2_9BACT|nr:DUF3298 domain-containing protein [Hymenobacter busanensis]KAA9338137.1 DUF3298 domain-containing protein [Hymenobacter busanensis]QHJ09439.1 hypothetical protein GUY19_19990 [Hymenobacter busanensis]